MLGNSESKKDESSFGSLGIADMQQVRFVVEKIRKDQGRMEEEFEVMLDLLEKNRNEDHKRLVTPEYL
jgi:hypothetical protein